MKGVTLIMQKVTLMSELKVGSKMSSLEMIYNIIFKYFTKNTMKI